MTIIPIALNKNEEKMLFIRNLVTLFYPSIYTSLSLSIEYIP